jgi:hypothetical protein
VTSQAQLTTASAVPSNRGNVTEALSSASALEHVGLSEALELCLLLTKQPARFERAALGWHGRYCRETRDVTFDEGVAVLVLLGAMRGPRANLAHPLLLNFSAGEGWNALARHLSRGRVRRRTVAKGTRSCHRL